MPAFSPKAHLFASISLALSLVALPVQAEDYQAAIAACRQQALQALNVTAEKLDFEVSKYSTLGVRQKLWLTLHVEDGEGQKAQCLYHSRENTAVLTMK
jgi:hypothetical protein